VLQIPPILSAAREAGKALGELGRTELNNDHPVQIDGGPTLTPQTKKPGTKADGGKKGDSGTKGDGGAGTDGNGDGSGPTGDGKGDGGSGDSTDPDGPSLRDVIPDLPGTGGDGDGQKDGDSKPDGKVDPPSGKKGGSLSDALIPDPLPLPPLPDSGSILP